MRVYANLLGSWTDITDTGTIANQQDPTTYFKENLCYLDGSKNAKCFEYVYIHVQYNGVDYRIHPAMIQILNQ